MKLLTRTTAVSQLCSGCFGAAASCDVFGALQSPRGPTSIFLCSSCGANQPLGRLVAYSRVVSHQQSQKPGQEK
eukprot:COSAG02_NODE_1111_length_14509_cov_3.543303_12_plen_74_part_00